MLWVSNTEFPSLSLNSEASRRKFIFPFSDVMLQFSINLLKLLFVVLY